MVRFYQTPLSFNFFLKKKAKEGGIGGRRKRILHQMAAGVGEKRGHAWIMAFSSFLFFPFFFFFFFLHACIFFPPFPFYEHEKLRFNVFTSS